MRLVFKFCMLFLLLEGQLLTQPFQFSVDGIFVSGEPGDFMQINGVVVNTRPDSLHLIMERVVNHIPTGWSTSLCLGIECYAAEVDIVSFSLGGNEIRDFALYFNSALTDPGVAEVRVRIREESNAASFREIRLTGSTNPNSIKQHGKVHTFSLQAAYPNPFNPVIKIPVTLHQTTELIVDIYNMQGISVKTITHGMMPKGDYIFSWDGRDNTGEAQPSGFYFLKVSNRGDFHIQKILLIK